MSGCAAVLAAAVAYEAEVRAEVSVAMAAARAEYRWIRAPDPEVKIECRPKGWGRSDWRRWTVGINARKLLCDREHVIKHTSRHEVAHLVANLIAPNEPSHGAWWRRVMADIGADPDARSPEGSCSSR